MGRVLGRKDILEKGGGGVKKRFPRVSKEEAKGMDTNSTTSVWDFFKNV